MTPGCAPDPVVGDGLWPLPSPEDKHDCRGPFYSLRSVSPSFSGLKGKTSLCKTLQPAGSPGLEMGQQPGHTFPLPWPSPPPSRALALCRCEVSAVAVRVSASFTAVTLASECSDGQRSDDLAFVILPVPSLHSDPEGPGQCPPLTCPVRPLLLPHPDSGLPSSALFVFSRLPLQSLFLPAVRGPF